MTINTHKHLNRLFATIGASSRPALIVLLALAGFGCTGNAQTGNKPGMNTTVEPAETRTMQSGGPVDTTSRPAGYNGPYQGKAVRKGPAVFAESDDLETSLRDASLGRVVLKYPPVGGGGGMELELPQKAVEVLDEFFRYRLKYTLDRRDRPPTNANEGFKLDMALIDARRKAEGALREIEIDAPDGRREFSYEETSNLVVFVRDAAIELVDGKEK